jgi:glutathione S-transferase
MRLFSNAMSPYGRKVMVMLHALELTDRVELVAAHPRERPEEVIAINPLGKIPVLVIDTGLELRDSPVIAEYLATEHGGASLLPLAGPDRWRILCEMADADGIIESAVLVKNERARPSEQQSTAFIAEHLGKIERGVATIDATAASVIGRRDLGAIAIGCALGYVPRRVPEFADMSRFTGAAAIYRDLLGWHAFSVTEPAT